MSSVHRTDSNYLLLIVCALLAHSCASDVHAAADKGTPADVESEERTGSGSNGGAAGGARYWEYIVVGAGPAGLQMAYFMDRAGRDYVVLERASSSGSFFEIYPRHGRLISINKRHTGKRNVEFNLRHDWNSLLSDDPALRFTRYSRELFPQSSDYVKYLNDFEQKLHLKVLHNTDVRNISRVNETEEEEEQKEGMNEVHFRMADQHGNVFTCKTLVIATGMWRPNIPPMEGEEFMEGYETVSTNAEDFEGQTVLILGVNNALLDTYQLKSLDGLLEAPLDNVRIVRNALTGRLSLDASSNTTGMEEGTTHDNFAVREPYDRVIRCLGFTFNDSLLASDDIVLTRGKGRKLKYPRISHAYESVDAPGVFFVGTATHSLDFRKSAGGFVHGFRYTVRALHHLLEQRDYSRPWPSRVGHVTDLLSLLLKRINEASGLYQMFATLADVIVLRGETFEYFEEFPSNLLPDFERLTGTKPVEGVIVVTLDYGANYSGPGEDTFRSNRATGDPSEASRSNFLHPVFYYYKQLPTKALMASRRHWESLPRPDRLHHTVEDFLTLWDGPITHVLPLRRFLEYCTGRDLRQFFAEDCLELALTHTSLPDSCRRQLSVMEDEWELEGNQPKVEERQTEVDVDQMETKMNGEEADLKHVKDEMKREKVGMNDEKINREKADMGEDKAETNESDEKKKQGKIERLEGAKELREQKFKCGGFSDFSLQLSSMDAKGFLSTTLV